MPSRVFTRRASRFLVEIDGKTQASFNECTIPDLSSEPVDFRNGGDPQTGKKIPGLIKYSNLSLKYGITYSMDLYNWFNEAILDEKTNLSHKNISVILKNELNQEVSRWDFSNCLPSKYDAPDLKADGDEIAIETLEIVFEQMTRVK